MEKIADYVKRKNNMTGEALEALRIKDIKDKKIGTVMLTIKE